MKKRDTRKKEHTKKKGHTKKEKTKKWTPEKRIHEKIDT